MFNSNCIFWNPINLVIIVLNEHVRTLSGPWWLGRVSVSILTFLTYSPEVVCSLNWEKQVQVPLSSCRDDLGQVFSRSHQFFGDTPLHPRCGLCTHCLSMFQDLGSHIVPWPFIPLTRHSLEAEWVAGCGLLPRGPVESSSPVLSPSLTLPTPVPRCIWDGMRKSWKHVFVTIWKSREVFTVFRGCHGQRPQRGWVCVCASVRRPWRQLITCYDVTCRMRLRTVIM